MTIIDKALIKRARELAGLTQEKAAALLYKHTMSWIRWENGQTKMDPILFEYFVMKTGVKDELYK